MILFRPNRIAKENENLPIASGGWITDTWNWLIGSGTTLVNIVNNIFSVAASVITAVKNAATAVLNAIKDGLQFLANLVLIVILELIIFAVKSIMKVMVELFNHLDETFDIEMIDQGMNINGIDIEIRRSGLNLIFEINGLRLDFGNYVGDPQVKIHDLEHEHV